MTWVPSEKGTLLIPSGTQHNPDLKHLFIICAFRDDGGETFLVSTSTWRNDLCDGTCILNAGDHPFITTKSYVLYRKARIEPVSVIVRGVETGDLIPREPLNDKPFDRVCAGIEKSSQLPWKLKRIYRRWLKE